MPSQHALRLALRPTRKAQRRRGVRPDQHTRCLGLQLRLAREAIAPTHITALQFSVVLEAECGYRGLDLEPLRYELGDGGGQLAGIFGGALDLDEEPGVRNF